GPRGPAGRWARAAPDRRQLGQPPQSWPHCPQPSQRSAATGPRWVLPGVAPAPAPKGRLFVREWRQRPPHTAQSPARTLLLPDACPTSNPKTQQPPRVAWTEFLYPTFVAKSRRGHPLLALPKHRESTMFDKRTIIGLPPSSCPALSRNQCCRPTVAMTPTRSGPLRVKLAANDLAFVQLASIRLWLRVNKSTI